MPRARVIETSEGIQGQADVTAFDLMQRSMRDRGWMETRAILRSGIAHGHALEVGPGPGYLGLEWLRHTEGTELTGLEISPAMIELARTNCRDYALTDRARYVHGDGSKLPFEAACFDAVFSNGSLHEWAEPVSTLREMLRVLKSGGILFVSDLRRDMAPVVRWLLWLTVKPRSMRPGLLTSLNAAYTACELESLVREAGVAAPRIGTDPFGLALTARR